jgi:hypothetical protein
MTILLLQVNLFRFTIQFFVKLICRKMKKYKFFIASLLLGFAVFSCTKDDSNSERFNLLTSHIWVSDSLLVNGIESGGPGGFLKNFKGDTKFNVDGTGYVGGINGKWEFYKNETQIVISSDSLSIPVTTTIVDLTTNSLKITTSYPTATIPPVIMAIRMTFKPK